MSNKLASDTGLILWLLTAGAATIVVGIGITYGIGPAIIGAGIVLMSFGVLGIAANCLPET